MDNEDEIYWELAVCKVSGHTNMVLKHKLFVTMITLLFPLKYQ